MLTCASQSGSVCSVICTPGKDGVHVCSVRQGTSWDDSLAAQTSQKQLVCLATHMAMFSMQNYDLKPD